MTRASGLGTRPRPAPRARARRPGPLTFAKRAAALTAVVLTLTTACEREDWGGPKGPPIPEPSAASPWTPPGFDPDSGPPSSGPSPADAGKTATAATLPPGSVQPPVDTGSRALVVRVEADLTSGKLPGWEGTIASLRPALKACAYGKGEPDAMVEISVRIGPKGNVTGTDKTGGSQFAQGVVPCIMHELERATFGKPTAGSPRLSVRVKLRRDAT